MEDKSVAHPLIVLKKEGNERSTCVKLPKRLKRLYGGDFFMAHGHRDRPRILVNFVQTIDGKISFNQPGQSGGGAISGGDLHDRLIMGILRAVANIVFVGANTLVEEPEHLWTPEYICPEYAEDLVQLRRSLRLPEVYNTGFLTRSGHVPKHARVFDDPASKVIFFTTPEGAQNIPASVTDRSQICTIHPKHFERKSAERMLTHYGARTALCEGGPRVFASFLEAQIVDELFVTTSPKLIGNTSTLVRPSLVEGHAFSHRAHPHLKLLSVRNKGSYLYSRYAL